MFPYGPPNSPRPTHPLIAVYEFHFFVWCSHADSVSAERDSLKDETVVVVFIFATAGLLGWALVKPWIDRLRERNTFAPIPQRDIPGVNIGR